MRFAGHEDVSQYLTSGPDLGKLSQKSAVNDAKVNIAGLRTEAMVGGAGLAEFGATMGNQAVTEAKGDYAAAQQQASNMSSAGGMLGNAIGGLGSLFGGGGGGGGGGFGSPGNFETGLSFTDGYNIPRYGF